MAMLKNSALRHSMFIMYSEDIFEEDQSMFLFLFQDDQNNTEHEIEITNITKEGCERADSSQFELLQTLGAGSFGKVEQRKKKQPYSIIKLYLFRFFSFEKPLDLIMARFMR